ncbi:hypothetical protein TRICI_006104 [Trichomonascus ciferrii]|uniref:Uncharacterized protein n=1 Tax=Trichomonascus ciferrii TaxID=44093 RepID=A0A642ULQ9_9ASCO|nr:hypothetical protein TRICI_006104 [Trichomonascus ciferrii]
MEKLIRSGQLYPPPAAAASLPKTTTPAASAPTAAPLPKQPTTTTNRSVSASFVNTTKGTASRNNRSFSTNFNVVSPKVTFDPFAPVVSNNSSYSSIWGKNPMATVWG